jgi:universal stress protein E
VASAEIALPKVQCTAVWGRRHWEAILTFAEMESADLIVKAHTMASTGQGLVRTPDDWNLLRHSSVPVLLMADTSWRDARGVVAALDVFDESHANLNRRVLRDAGVMARCLGGELHVVSVYPRLQPWVGEMGVVTDYADLVKRLVDDVSERAAAMLDEAGLADARFHVLEGDSADAIAQFAQSSSSGLVVLGTHARVGIRAAVLGNTSERLIHRLHQDVLTVC